MNCIEPKETPDKSLNFLLRLLNLFFIHSSTVPITPPVTLSSACSQVPQQSSSVQKKADTKASKHINSSRDVSLPFRSTGRVIPALWTQSFLAQPHKSPQNSQSTVISMWASTKDEHIKPKEVTFSGSTANFTTHKLLVAWLRCTPAVAWYLIQLSMIKMGFLLSNNGKPPATASSKLYRNPINIFALGLSESIIRNICETIKLCLVSSKVH